jgi:pyruvate carboxylase subunit B
MAYLAEIGERSHRIEIHDTGDTTFRVEIDGAPYAVDSRQIRVTTYSVLVDGRSYVAEVTANGDQYAVTVGGALFRLRVVDERRHTPIVLGTPEEERGRREIRAHMPGKVVDVLVQVGDLVERDQGLLVIEAMKMENEIKAAAPGEVKDIRVTRGQAVETGEILMVVE